MTKKSQSKAGIPEQRRGQQMGDERGQTDKSLKAKKETAALRGRRKSENKFYGDDSSQAVGSDGATPRDNSPSLPAAIPTDTPLGQSDGERNFNRSRRKRR